MIADEDRCRYLRRSGEQCTAEAAITSTDDIMLCTKHLAAAWKLVQDHRTR